ncbi:hypothetical protein GCM10009529_01320 [Micropruina glycogenica]
MDGVGETAGPDVPAPEAPVQAVVMNRTVANTSPRNVAAIHRNYLARTIPSNLRTITTHAHCDKQFTCASAQSQSPGRGEP